MKKQTDNGKPGRNRVSVTLQILRSRLEVYAQASKEIERRTGQAPGAEAMMVYELENTDDPCDLADLYCWNVLKWSAKQINRFSKKSTGEQRAKKPRTATKS